MWPRKQLDIGWSDLVCGLCYCIASRRPISPRSIVGKDWIPPDEAVVALSVRSGLDLLLEALQLPPGSEVIVSAVTIPDMARIIEHHHLVPVPVDVDAQTLQPAVDQIERVIGPRTRAILVAHLFGTHAEMGPIIELARLHDLLVIEDCAQAYVGPEYAGHPASTCALFSFGPIKTATALGGAVARVPDAALRSRMIQLQRAYPKQTRWHYFKRLAKYAAFRLLGLPLFYGLLVRTLKLLGVDYDRALGNAAHSFGSSDFYLQIRRQPCRPLLGMLQRRIEKFEPRGARRLRQRIARGDQLSHLLDAGMVVGDGNDSHTYWVMPVRVANRDAVVGALRQTGFDATARSSLIVVPTPDDRANDDRPLAPWLSETIFLPGGEQMPDDEWDRLIGILQEVALPVPAAPTRELVSHSGVSVSA